MNNNLKKVEFSEVSSLIKDRDVLQRIKQENRPVFIIDEKQSSKAIINDPILDLEITLRKCERVGVFKK